MDNKNYIYEDVLKEGSSYNCGVLSIFDKNGNEIEELPDYTYTSLLGIKRPYSSEANASSVNLGRELHLLEYQCGPELWQAYMRIYFPTQNNSGVSFAAGEFTMTIALFK